MTILYHHSLATQQMHKKCSGVTLIKTLRKEQTSINALHYNGEIHVYTDSEAKANTLNNYFVSVFTNEDQSPLPHFSNVPAPNISELTINIDGVFNLLSKTEPSKVAGPNEIPPRLLKETASHMAPLLTFIFSINSTKTSIGNLQYHTNLQKGQEGRSRKLLAYISK